MRHKKLTPYWRLERPELTLPVRVDPTGAAGPTPSQARGPRWRRSSQGLFVPSDVDPTVVEQRIVEAAAVLPIGGGVTGWAALRWLGGYWFDGTRGDGTLRPVDLAAGPGKVRHQDGIRISEEYVRVGEVTTVDGMPVTSAVRSVCFLMRHARDVRAAVVALDLAAYNDLVSIDEAARYAATLGIWTGIPQCRQALGLGDENAWSPPETLARLVWVIDAGLSRPLCNRPVFDLDGRHIGTPDLLDEEAGLVGEYDGRLHLAGAQRRRDRDRDHRYRQVGLEVVTLMAGDVAVPVRAAELITEARSRSRFEAESRRRWTVDPPHWWTPTFTVQQRRALDPVAREQLLGLRGKAG